MRTRVKICCIASLDEARMAVDAGADALGLVSDMPSGPGVIAESVIREVAEFAPPPVSTVLLTCLQSAGPIAEQHARCRTTAIQLVDYVPGSELKRLRQLLPSTGLLQVVHVTGEQSIDEAVEAAPLVDAILLDSGDPRLEVKVLGGTGQCHDWRLSADIRARIGVPLFLAGGLNAENVGDAIHTVRPFAVDVCSGVRTEGRLDPDKLARYMAAVRQADDRIATC